MMQGAPTAMSEQVAGGGTPEQEPVEDALDQSTELVGGKRPARTAMSTLARGAIYGAAFVLVSGLSALAMFPELTRYAEPLLGAGKSELSTCGQQGACCQSKSEVAASPCDEGDCPASESPSTPETETADTVAEVAQPSTPADEAAAEQQSDASATQIAADETASTDE